MQFVQCNSPIATHTTFLIWCICNSIFVLFAIVDSSLIIEALGEYMLTRLHMLLLLLNQPKKNGHLLTNLLPTLHQNGDDLGDGDYEHVCVLCPQLFSLSLPPSLLVRHNTGCCAITLICQNIFLGLASQMQIWLSIFHVDFLSWWKNMYTTLSSFNL